MSGRLGVARTSEFASVRGVGTCRGECNGRGCSGTLGRIGSRVGRPVLSLFRVKGFDNLARILFVRHYLGLLGPNNEVKVILPRNMLGGAGLRGIHSFIRDGTGVLLVISVPRSIFVTTNTAMGPDLLFFGGFARGRTRRCGHVCVRMSRRIRTGCSRRVASVSIGLTGHNGRTLAGSRGGDLQSHGGRLATLVRGRVGILIGREFSCIVPVTRIRGTNVDAAKTGVRGRLRPLRGRFARCQGRGGL